MKKLVYTATAAVAFALAAPAAQAAIFTVNVTSPTPINPVTNNFTTNLALAGLTRLTNGGISLDGPALVRFEFLGTESGFFDTFFTVNGTTFTENSTGIVNQFAAPTLISNEFFGAGPLSVSFRNSGNAVVSSPGSTGFGVFLPTLTGSTYSSSVLYFGYDDQITNIDDNHDDLVIRATILPVPEPSTWALMLLGFGAVGYSLRRRPAYKMAQAV